MNIKSFLALVAIYLSFGVQAQTTTQPVTSQYCTPTRSVCSFTAGTDTYTLTYPRDNTHEVIRNNEQKQFCTSYAEQTYQSSTKTVFDKTYTCNDGTQIVASMTIYRAIRGRSPLPVPQFSFESVTR